MDIRLHEAEQKNAALTDKINRLNNAVTYLMKIYEEMIILTDRWEGNVHPYLIRDAVLMERKDHEIRIINRELKAAKQQFRQLMAGERIPDVSSDTGKGRKQGNKK